MYDVVSVTVDPQQRCSQTGHIPVNESQGLLTSLTAQQQGLGTDSCPWVIYAQPGQLVNITLWDFTQGPGSDSPYCRVYASITDLGSRTSKNVVACDGEATVKRVYTSKGQRVAVEVTFLVSSQADPAENNFFALKYEGKSPQLFMA